MPKQVFLALLLCAVQAGGLALPSVAASGGDAHGEGHHDPGHGNAADGMDDASEFQGDLAIYTFVVFCLLFGLLSKFAWPTISQALVEREERIEGNIAAAESKHEEAKQLLAQHEAKLAQAADEVRELLEEARRDAEHTKGQIIAEAQKAAEAERLRGVREVEIAADHAMQRLAETSANLAVDLAGKIVRQNITPEQQSSLVQEALGRLGNGSPSNN
ncbi:MAG: F0F1 ATP synthase subunit B [Planctomycetota bacterium]